MTRKNKYLLFFSLTVQVRETIVGLNIDKLSRGQGAEKLIELDNLYLKGSQYSEYKSHKRFEKFCRPKSISISHYIIEFGRSYNKFKAFFIPLPDAVLIYKFLNITNISKQCQRLQHANRTGSTSVLQNFHHFF